MFNKLDLNKLFFIVVTLSIFNLQAQDASDESVDSMEEVITTARRTEESVSNVPIAISAFSGTDLDEKGITNMEDIRSLVPNMMIQKSAGNQSVAYVSVIYLPEVMPSIQAITSAIWIGAVSTGIGFIGYVGLIDKIGAVKTSTVAYFLPVCGII